MKDNTKKYLKVAGGAIVGAGLLLTGNFFLSSAIGFALIKSGRILPPVGITVEMAKQMSSKGAVAMDAFRAGVCLVGGFKFLGDASRELQTIKKEPKTSVTAPPPGTAFEEAIRS